MKITKKNNKGQVFLVGLMLGIFAFILAMVFIDPLSDVINEVRGSSQLDCSNSSISDGHKLTCLEVDLILPLFIGVVIALAGGYVTAKFITA